MKAPLTGNSITDRVVFTGLYVPDAPRQADPEGVEPAPRDASGADPRADAQQA